MDWPATVVQVSDNDWDALIRQDVPVFVDFWAPWCSPCRAFAPIFDDLATAYAGKVIMAKLDVDSNPIVAERYRITSIPMLLLFRGGKPVDRMIGAAPRRSLEQFIDRNL